jgi:hypothetical protein
MQEQPHWRRLLLRSEETASRYEVEIEERKHSAHICPLCEFEDVIREFEHWVIMKNKFPYDRYFSKSDMLVSRRHAAEDAITDKERDEYHYIRTHMLGDEYDTVMNHLPKQKSLPNHYHVHLIQIKRHDGLPR